MNCGTSLLFLVATSGAGVTRNEKVYFLLKKILEENDTSTIITALKTWQAEVPPNQSRVVRSQISSFFRLILGNLTGSKFDKTKTGALSANHDSFLLGAKGVRYKFLLFVSVQGEIIQQHQLDKLQVTRISYQDAIKVTFTDLRYGRFDCDKLTVFRGNPQRSSGGNQNGAPDITCHAVQQLSMRQSCKSASCSSFLFPRQPLRFSAVCTRESRTTARNSTMSQLFDAIAWQMRRRRKVSEIHFCCCVHLS